MDSFSKCCFENTCPIEEIASGHQSNRRFSSPAAQITPFWSPAWHPRADMQLLAKEKVFSFKMYYLLNPGVFRTFSTSVLQIFSVQTLTGGNSYGDFTEDLLHGEFIWFSIIFSRKNNNQMKERQKFIFYIKFWLALRTQTICFSKNTFS